MSKQTCFHGKKICFVSYFYHPFNPVGGAEYQTYLIATEFQKKGAKIYFLNPDSNSRDDRVIFDKGKTIYCFHKRLPINKLGSNYFFNFNILNKYLNEIKPDFIFQRGLMSLSAGCAIYAERKNIPYILSIANDKNLLKLNVSTLLRDPLFEIDRIIGKIGIKRATAVLIQSKFQQDFLNEHYNRHGILVRNIFDNNSLMNINVKKDQIVCHCKFNKTKSPATCYKLAEILPHRDIIIAGIEEDSKRLKKFTKSDHVPDNVKIVGILKKNEFIKLVSESKILLSTSLVEGFSNTFVEAWINKTAIVSLNINPDNLLSEKKYGYYAKGDIGLLANQIEILLNDDNLFHKIVEKSYGFAKKEFDLEKNIEKIEALFLNLNSPLLAARDG